MSTETTERPNIEIKPITTKTSPVTPIITSTPLRATVGKTDPLDTDEIAEMEDLLKQIYSAEWGTTTNYFMYTEEEFKEKAMKPFTEERKKELKKGKITSEQYKSKLDDFEQYVESKFAGVKYSHALNSDLIGMIPPLRNIDIGKKQNWLGREATKQEGSRLSRIGVLGELIVSQKNRNHASDPILKFAINLGRPQDPDAIEPPFRRFLFSIFRNTIASLLLTVNFALIRPLEDIYNDLKSNKMGWIRAFWKGATTVLASSITIPTKWCQIILGGLLNIP